MTTTHEKKSVQLTAADWLARRNEGLTPAESAQLRAWLDADASHASAFSAAEQTWAALMEPQSMGRSVLLEQHLDGLRAKRGGRRRAGILAWAGLAAAAAIALMVFAPSAPTARAPVTTVTVRPDRQVLPDGSVVELNAGAEISVAFSPEIRGVHLVRGEALFTVTKNPSRPFVVSAGDISVRAVGTAFSVKHGSQAVAVLVTEGRVAVERTAAVAAPAVATEINPTYLNAGESLVVPANLAAGAPLAVALTTPQQIAAGLAWRGSRVEFTGTPLTEAVALLNAQNKLQLSLADPAVGRLQLTGIFWADDPEGFVRLLEDGMNVTAERTASGIALKSKGR